MKSRTSVGPAAIAVVLTLLTACDSGGGAAAHRTSSGSSSSSSSAPSSSSSAPPSQAAASGLPTPDHVMVVIFENKAEDSVVGAPEAPYLTSLAASGARLADAHAETHPSQPNYLALFSGSTQGVTDDHCPLTLSGPTLASELAAAGRTFVGYSENLPSAGFTGCHGDGGYARKHNPWVNFGDLPASVNQPYSALPADFAALPTVSFVVPNLCNDMHDCDVAAGDTWSGQHLPAYVAWAQAHNSLLVVTFDESRGSDTNHIATLLVGPMVVPGTYDQRIDHYSLLRTLEDMYGLPPLGQSAAAAPVTGVWTTASG